MDKKLTDAEKNYIKANIGNRSIDEIISKIGKDRETIIDYAKNISTTKTETKLNTPQNKKDKKSLSERIKIIPYNLSKNDYITAFFMFLAALVLYTITITPSMSSGDNGELTTASYFLGVAHAPGYPFYIFMEKIFLYIPFFNIAWRANFFSVFCTAGSIFFVYLLFVKILGQNRTSKGFIPEVHIPSAFAAFMFAFSDNMWSQAVMAETYALNVLQISILLFILLLWFEDVWKHSDDENAYLGARYLMAFGFLYGVALGNQHLVLPFGLAPLPFIFVVIILANKHRYVKNIEISLISIFVFFIFITIGGIGYMRFIMSYESNLFFHYTVPKDLSIFEIVLKPLTNPALFTDILKVFSDKTYLMDYAKISTLSDPLYPNLYKGMFVIFWPTLLMIVWFVVYHFILQRTKRFGQDSDYISSATMVYYQMFFTFLLGVLVYVYMPIRARAMPPLNWGQLNEPSGWENLSYFFNMLHRKQYGNAGADVKAHFIMHPEQLIAAVGIYIKQLTLVVVLFLIPGIINIFKKNKPIAIFTSVCFVMFTIPLWIFINPPVNDRSMAIFEVFFNPGTLYYSIIILFGMSWYLQYSGKNIKNFFSKTETQIEYSGKWYKRISVPQYIVVVLMMCVLAYPFCINFKRNNESNNWSNHDYPYNIMNTLPPNSIIATEGGDNQVFGLAYYTMVERRRPDIKVYDQKGNVFERIYGNLMKVNYNWIGEISDTVDKAFIESGRPYYTTWRRNGLARLGDYYFKQYGILYRVNPIRYLFVDELEFFKNMTVSEYAQMASEALERPYQAEKVSKDINMLLDEGLIKTERKNMYNGNETVYFIQGYELPFENLKNDYDYFDRYVIRGNNEEIKTWDYLTREIFTSYAASKIEVYDRDIKRRMKLLAKEKNVNAKINIEKEIEELQSKKEKELSFMLDVGNDMPHVLFRAATTESAKGNHENAIKLFKDVLKSDRNAYQAYINIALTYEAAARNPKTPETQEREYLLKAKSELEKAKKIFFRAKGETEKTLQNNNAYQQILYMISRMDAQMQMTRTQASILENQAKEINSAESYLSLAEFYLRRYDGENAEINLLKAQKLPITNRQIETAIELQLANIYANSQRFLLAEEIYKRYATQTNIEGAVSLYMLAQMAEARNKLEDAMKIYNRFLSQFSSMIKDPEISQYYEVMGQRAVELNNYLNGGR